MLSLKPGVSIAKLTPQALMGVMIVMEVYRGMKKDLTITSGDDGKHMVGSKHYEGNAFDIRTRGMSSSEKADVARMIREVIGEDFDVVVEPTHIHVEYDPPAEVPHLQLGGDPT